MDSHGLIAGAPDGSDNLMYVVILTVLVVFLAAMFSFLKFGLLWIRALFSGVHVSLFRILAMTLRRVPVEMIISNSIKARHAGVAISLNEMERFYLQGGDVPTVVEAVIMARDRKIDMTWEKACEFERAGKLSRKLRDGP